MPCPVSVCFGLSFGYFFYIIYSVHFPIKKIKKVMYCLLVRGIQSCGH